MEHTHTQPAAEKLQIKFHNQNAPDLENGNEANSAELQRNFKIQKEIADIQHEFETQYEQFLNNISAARKRA